MSMLIQDENEYYETRKEKMNNSPLKTLAIMILHDGNMNYLFSRTSFGILDPWNLCDILGVLRFRTAH